MRLLTLNVGSVEAQWTRRAGEIAIWLARTAPDVIALQEISYRDSRNNSISEIFAHLDCDGYRRHFAGHPLGPEMGSFGVALLSRIAPCATGQFDLPPDSESVAPRSVAWIQLAKTRIYSVHLSADPHNTERRLAQVEVLRVELQSIGNQRVILCGDLNCDPADLAIRRLLTPPNEGEVWIGDMWRHLNPNVSGFTWDATRNPLAHRRNAPQRRLDYILAPLAVARTAKISIVCDTSLSGVYASDHFGLLADLPSLS